MNKVFLGIRLYYFSLDDSLSSFFEPIIVKNLLTDSKFVERKEFVYHNQTELVIDEIHDFSIHFPAELLYLLFP